MEAFVVIIGGGPGLRPGFIGTLVARTQAGAAVGGRRHAL